MQIETYLALAIAMLTCWLCAGVAAVLCGKWTLRKWVPLSESGPDSLALAITVTLGFSLLVAILVWPVAELFLLQVIPSGFMPSVVYFAGIAVFIPAVLRNVFISRISEMRSATRSGNTH